MRVESVEVDVGDYAERACWGAVSEGGEMFVCVFAAAAEAGVGRDWRRGEGLGGVHRGRWRGCYEFISGCVEVVRGWS